MIQLFKHLFGMWRSLTACALTIIISGCGDSQYQQQSQYEPEPQWRPDSEKPPEPKTLFAMARLLAAQGKDEQAQFVLEKVIAQQPDLLPAYVDLAELHMRNNRVEAARRTLEQGLKCRPNDAVILNDLGMTFVVKGDYTSAEKLFAQATQACPTETRFKTNLAMAKGMQGQYDEALQLYQQVLRPDQAHYNLGVIAEARQDSDRASREFVLADNAAAAQATTQPCPPGKR